jgi:hypothetical protein
MRSESVSISLPIHSSTTRCELTCRVSQSVVPAVHVSGHTDNEEVRALLDRCVRLRGDIVERLGGVVDNIGDAVLAPVRFALRTRGHVERRGARCVRDAAVCTRARRRLSAASRRSTAWTKPPILMDRPPGGWNDLVTDASLHRELGGLETRIDLKLEALESRMDAKFTMIDARFDRFKHPLLAHVDRRRRQQSWVSISTVIASMGIIVAAVRV